MNEPDALPVIAANGSGQEPMSLMALGGVTDINDEQADWEHDDGDDEQADLNPCNHCPHDNADHRGDGCLHCGCDTPQ